MSFEFNAAEQFESGGQATDNQTSEGSTQSSEQAVQTQATPKDQPASLVDVDSVEKFRFQGREWTPKELQAAVLMQSDYTKKTQALAKEREYVSNFPVDLGHLAQNPDLLDRFKELYPESYHAAAEAIAQRVAAGQSPQQAVQQVTQQVQQQGQQTSNGFQLPKEYLDEFNAMKRQLSEVTSFKEEQTNRAADAELSAIFSKNTKEFPYADEEKVTVWAQELLKQGTKLTDEVWTKIFEKSHKDAIERSDRIYKERVDQQKTTNRKAFAGSPGGATPGSAPKLPKTISEATRMLRESGQLEG
jgi:hypothetical protein